MALMVSNHHTFHHIIIGTVTTRAKNNKVCLPGIPPEVSATAAAASKARQRNINSTSMMYMEYPCTKSLYVHDDNPAASWTYNVWTQRVWEVQQRNNMIPTCSGCAIHPRMGTTELVRRYTCGYDKYLYELAWLGLTRVSVFTHTYIHVWTK